MPDKRTRAQLEFDMAKHGWVFCNAAMLTGKLIRLRPIAEHLGVEDKRHETLALIEAAARKEAK